MKADFKLSSEEYELAKGIATQILGTGEDLSAGQIAYVIVRAAIDGTLTFKEENDGNEIESENEVGVSDADEGASEVQGTEG